MGKLLSKYRLARGMTKIELSFILFSVALKNVKEEHRNLEAHCIKESEKNNVLRRTIESLVSVYGIWVLMFLLPPLALLQNQELQELRGKKDKR